MTRSLLTREEALAAVLERVRVLAAEDVSVADATGRFLAGDARAVVDLPPFASSAMDGFAVRAEDAPGRLPVVGRIAAGAPAERALGPGEAMAIATGGVVPDGADTDSNCTDFLVQPAPATAMAVLKPGQQVQSMIAGHAVARGTRLVSSLHPGLSTRCTFTTAQEVTLWPISITSVSYFQDRSALAAAGIGRVSCTRRPRVAVLSTGTELRRPGEPLAAGEVYEANAAMLAAALASANAEVTELPAVADDEDAHRAALEEALTADVVVTSGGVSVGPHDLVRRVRHELGVEEVFWGVAVKPGKPLSFGVRGVTLVFGLPGNPVSAQVTFDVFVRAALLRMQGATVVSRPRVEVELLDSVKNRSGRQAHSPARVAFEAGRLVARPLASQGSADVVAHAQANALVILEAGQLRAEAGEKVPALLLGNFLERDGSA